MCEAGRDQHLLRDCDRARRVERGARDDVLQRLPLAVLHRDVVGAVELAPVVDADDVRVLQAGRGGRLAPEALHELLILRKPRVQQFHRHLATEVRVLGAVHVGHSSRAELAQDAIAAVDHRPLGDHRSSSCMTCFAIGAATVPPWPVVLSTVTAIATRASARERTR